MPDEATAPLSIVIGSIQGWPDIRDSVHAAEAAAQRVGAELLVLDGSGLPSAASRDARERNEMARASGGERLPAPDAWLRAEHRTDRRHHRGPLQRADRLVRAHARGSRRAPGSGRDRRVGRERRSRLAHRLGQLLHRAGRGDGPDSLRRRHAPRRCRQRLVQALGARRDERLRRPGRHGRPAPEDAGGARGAARGR